MGNVRRLTPCRRSKCLIASFLSVVLLSVGCGTVTAADWSVQSVLSQRMEFDDNRSVIDPSAGNVLTSISNLATTVNAVTPSHSFSLSHSIDYIAYAGPGASGLENTFDYDDFSMTWSGSRKLTTYGVSARFSRDPTSVTEFEDTGLTTTNAERLSLTASADLSHQINNNNAVSLNVSATNTDFTEDVDGLTPFFNASSSLTWTHSINNLTSGNVTGGLSYSKFDDDQNSRDLVFTTTVGLSRDLTKRLSASANVGANVSRSENDATLMIPASSEVLVGFNGDLNVSYNPNSDTSMSLSLTQGLAPSASDELQSRTSLIFSLNHAINSYSSFSLAVNASHQQSASETGSTDRQTLSVSPTYSRQLTSKWNSSLGYVFRYSDSGMSKATSNKVFVSVSRVIDLVP